MDFLRTKFDGIVIARVGWHHLCHINATDMVRIHSQITAQMEHDRALWNDIISVASNPWAADPFPDLGAKMPHDRGLLNDTTS